MQTKNTLEMPDRKLLEPEPLGTQGLEVWWTGTWKAIPYSLWVLSGRRHKPLRVSCHEQFPVL